MSSKGEEVTTIILILFIAVPILAGIVMYELGGEPEPQEQPMEWWISP